MLPDGTAIGSGLATSLTRLRHSQAKSKVIVLVTDGSNNAGEIDPATATDLARAMEVRVYTIAVGRGGMVPMPTQFQDPFSGHIMRRTVMTEVQIDEGLLKSIADRTRGEFFRATDPAALRTIFDRIDRSRHRRSRWPPTGAIASSTCRCWRSRPPRSSSPARCG
jgi:Ca-activated chloride channel family protein